jgi:hypothetical protein
MLKKITTLAVFAAAIGVAAANAHANTIAGRVTSFSPSSISVFDREVVTIGMNGDTKFTKLIIKKPWQENATLTVNALSVGGYVVVHTESGIAKWVQVAMDRPVIVERGFAAYTPTAVVPPAFMTEATRHRAEAATLRKAAGLNYAAPVANPGALVAQANSGDILSASEVRNLIANAKTPADHHKLARHFAAVAARYEADAADHVGEAKAYRSAPNSSESKRPGSPATAAHCDRLADAARSAAAAARELARDHENMAK